LNMHARLGDGARGGAATRLWKNLQAAAKVCGRSMIAQPRVAYAQRLCGR